MYKEPPSGFVRTLKSYNKDLRVRWSYEKDQWVIECKVADRRGLFKPVKFFKKEDGTMGERRLPELSDLYIGWRDGYYSVCHLKNLTPRALDALAAADTQHFKSHAHLARSIEEREAKAEARTERIRREESYAHSNEVYDYMSNRGSMAFPGGTSL